MTAKRSTIRKQANNKLLRVLRRLGSECFWCGRALVALRSIPQQWILKLTYAMVTWKGERGDVQHRHIATADHLVELRNGGKSNIENLVPACRPCNGRRAENASTWTAKERELFSRKPVHVAAKVLRERERGAVDAEPARQRRVLREPQRLTYSLGEKFPATGDSRMH